LDYDNDTQDAKTYYKAIAKLETPFDGQAENVSLFLANTQERSRRFGWSTTLTIPDANNANRNLITEYGQVTMQEVMARAQQYIGQPTRDAQNSDMLYHYIMNSLTDSFKSEVLLYVDQYTVNNTPDGICLLKQILLLTFIDTRATASHIKDTLLDMGQKLTELSGDVTALNIWVRAQLAKLYAGGHSSPDLLPLLWKTYRAAPDKEFVLYIKDLKNQYEDGRANYTAQEVMVLAENKYKAYKQSGEWGKPSDEQAEIVALTSKINVLQKKLTTAKSAPSNQRKTDSTSGKTDSKNSLKNSNNKEKGKGKQKKGKKKGDNYAWKLVSPTGSETMVDGHPTKTVEGQLYNWCKHHEDGKGKWVLHNPKDCNNDPAKSSSNKDSKTSANLAAFDTYDSDDE
jgi:hypothetical protein